MNPAGAEVEGIYVKNLERFLDAGVRPNFLDLYGPSV